MSQGVDGMQILAQALRDRRLRAERERAGTTQAEQEIQYKERLRQQYGETPETLAALDAAEAQVRVAESPLAKRRLEALDQLARAETKLAMSRMRDQLDEAEKHRDAVAQYTLRQNYKQLFGLAAGQALLARQAAEVISGRTTMEELSALHTKKAEEVRSRREMQATAVANNQFMAIAALSGMAKEGSDFEHVANQLSAELAKQTASAGSAGAAFDKGMTETTPGATERLARGLGKMVGAVRAPFELGEQVGQALSDSTQWPIQERVQSAQKNRVPAKMPPLTEKQIREMYEQHGKSEYQLASTEHTDLLERLKAKTAGMGDVHPSEEELAAPAMVPPGRAERTTLARATASSTQTQTQTQPKTAPVQYEAVLRRLFPLLTEDRDAASWAVLSAGISGDTEKFKAGLAKLSPLQQNIMAEVLGGTGKMMLLLSSVDATTAQELEAVLLSGAVEEGKPLSAKDKAALASLGGVVKKVYSDEGGAKFRLMLGDLGKKVVELGADLSSANILDATTQVYKRNVERGIDARVQALAKQMNVPVSAHAMKIALVTTDTALAMMESGASSEELSDLVKRTQEALGPKLGSELPGLMSAAFSGMMPFMRQLKPEWYEKYKGNPVLDPAAGAKAWAGMAQQVPMMERVREEMLEQVRLAEAVQAGAVDVQDVLRQARDPETGQQFFVRVVPAPGAVEGSLVPVRGDSVQSVTGGELAEPASSLYSDGSTQHIDDIYGAAARLLSKPSAQKPVAEAGAVVGPVVPSQPELSQPDVDVTEPLPSASAQAETFVQAAVDRLASARERALSELQPGNEALASSVIDLFDRIDRERRSGVRGAARDPSELGPQYLGPGFLKLVSETLAQYSKPSEPPEPINPIRPQAQPAQPDQASPPAGPGLAVGQQPLERFGPPVAGAPTPNRLPLSGALAAQK